jgi:integrase
MAGKRRGHGEGSIYQDAQERWRAVVDLGWVNGKRDRKYLSGKTRREVQQKLTAALRDQQQGLPLAPERQTIERFLLSWLDDVAQPSVRPRVFIRYRELLTLHAIPTLGKRPLTKLQPQEVNSLYAKKRSEGLSAQTVTHLHRVLHRALSYAVRWNLVPRNVCDLVDPPRVTRPEGQWLNPEQARCLLAAASGDALEALYVLALTTGMRQSELLGLKWGDVDLRSGALQVRRALQRVPGRGFVEAEPKSAKSRRYITLTPLGIDALRNHRARQNEQRLAAGPLWEDRDLVFCNSTGRPLEHGNLLRRSYQPLLGRARLPKVRFHDLRHSTASLLGSLGVPAKVIQEIMGHSQIGVTMDVYSHTMPGMQADAMARLNDLLQAGP